MRGVPAGHEGGAPQVQLRPPSRLCCWTGCRQFQCQQGGCLPSLPAPIALPNCLHVQDTREASDPASNLSVSVLAELCLAIIHALPLCLMLCAARVACKVDAVLILAAAGCPVVHSHASLSPLMPLLQAPKQHAVHPVAGQQRGQPTAGRGCAVFQRRAGCCRPQDTGQTLL